MAGSRTPAHYPRSKLFGTRAADRGRLPTPQCAGLFLSALGQTGDAIEQARPTALLWYLAGFGHFFGPYPGLSLKDIECNAGKNEKK